VSPNCQHDFSVLMSVYRNDPVPLFRNALQSIFDNTLQPYEVILVVDGPVGHGLNSVIDEFVSKYLYLKVVPLTSNVGLARALNRGLDFINTDWVARADSDDINELDRFQKQISFIKASETDVDVLGGQIEEYDVDGRYISSRTLPCSHDDIVRFGKRRNPINHMSVFYRVDIVRAVGGYPPVHLKEDYALWATMLKAGAQFCNLPSVLVRATTGRDMYKRRGGLRYVVSEISLQRYLVKNGLKYPASAVFDLCLRSAIFLLPGWLRGFFYEKFLRTRSVSK